VAVIDPLTDRTVSTLAGNIETQFLAPTPPLSPDGRLLATLRNQSLVVWDTTTSRPVLTKEGVVGVAFGPSSRHIVCTNGDGTIQVWDAATGQPGPVLGTPLTEKLVPAFPGRPSNLPQPRISADGSHVAWATKDGSVQVWDARSGRPGMVLRGHVGGTRWVLLNATGNRIFTAGAMGPEVKVWDVESGQEVLTLRQEKEVSEVALSPDGRRLATLNTTGARIWDATTLPEGAKH
jgi:WD40 repeat protein